MFCQKKKKACTRAVEWAGPMMQIRLSRSVIVHATVTQYTKRVNGVSLPTDQPHGRVTVHGCAVRSPLTGCQVTSRPRDRFSRYSKWLDTFRTGFARYLICFQKFVELPNVRCGTSLKETAALGLGMSCTAKIGSSVFLVVFTALGFAWYC